jgi:hypothetical protein
MPERRRLNPALSADWHIPAPNPGGRNRVFVARNRSPNILVEGMLRAMLDKGKEWLAERGLLADDVINDEDLMGAFMSWVIVTDLPSFTRLAGKLVPRDVRLNIQQGTRLQILAPAQLLAALAAKGLRVPQQYRISSGHANDDDQVTEAEIVTVVEGR